MNSNTTPNAYKLCLLANLFSVICGITIKLIGDEIPILQLLFMQFLIMNICLLPLMIKRKLFYLPHKTASKHYLIRSICGMVGCLTYFYGITHIKITDVIIVSRTFPIIMVVLAFVVLRERITASKLLACGFGLLGTIIAVNPKFNSSLPIILIVLAGVFSDAIAALSIKRLTQTEPPLKMLYIYSCVVVVLLGMVMPFIWKSFSLLSIGSLLAIIVVGTLSYQYLYLVSYQKLNANIVGILTNSQIIFSMAISFVIFREGIENEKAIGISILSVSYTHLTLPTTSRV